MNDYPAILVLVMRSTPKSTKSLDITIFPFLLNAIRHAKSLAKFSDTKTNGGGVGPWPGFSGQETLG